MERRARRDNGKTNFGGECALVPRTLRPDEFIQSLLVALMLLQLLGRTAWALPPVPNIEGHLTDAGARLPKQEKQAIDDLFGSIQGDCKVDVAALILTTPVESLQEMGKITFATWSIGKAWDGGGILLIISPDLKDCALIMSDQDSPLSAQCATQLEQQVRDRLSQGQLSHALRSAAGRIHRLQAIKKPRSDVAPPYDPNPLDPNRGATPYALGSLAMIALACLSTKLRRWK